MPLFTMPVGDSKNHTAKLNLRKEYTRLSLVYLHVFRVDIDRWKNIWNHELIEPIVTDFEYVYRNPGLNSGPFVRVDCCWFNYVKSSSSVKVFLMRRRIAVYHWSKREIESYSLTWKKLKFKSVYWKCIEKLTKITRNTWFSVQRAIVRCVYQFQKKKISFFNLRLCVKIMTIDSYEIITNSAKHSHSNVSRRFSDYMQLKCLTRRHVLASVHISLFLYENGTKLRLFVFVGAVTLFPCKNWGF